MTNNTIELVVLLASTFAAFLYMRSMRKQIPKGQKNTQPLSSTEKRTVILLVILSPLVAGAIFYYGWIKRLPAKAKSANKYSFIAAAILIIFLLILGV